MGQAVNLTTFTVQPISHLLLLLLTANRYVRLRTRKQTFTVQQDDQFLVELGDFIQENTQNKENLVGRQSQIGPQAWQDESAQPQLGTKRCSCETLLWQCRQSTAAQEWCCNVRCDQDVACHSDQPFAQKIFL